MKFCCSSSRNEAHSVQNFSRQISRHFSPDALVAQPLDPPIALEGIATPIAPMFFRYRRVSRDTPPKFALSQPRERGGKGYRSSSSKSQAALWRASRYTGVSLRWYCLSRFDGPLSQTLCSCKCPISWHFSFCRRCLRCQMMEAFLCPVRTGNHGL